ncbi:MAG: class I SAM-dependent methyltransferase [Kiritimatiellae bacterium]|jgi:adenine-specific DNA-methyltransferase|nr:class I SAM-dependent methyltransferase [Kiritimatiellia bacterium]
MKKSRGAYYTPTKIARFMVDYAGQHLGKKKLTVLEPSVGDGAFVRALKERNCAKFTDLTMVELDKGELEKASVCAKKGGCFGSVDPLNADFLSAGERLASDFSLVLGNPPYIKKSTLSTGTLEECHRIYRRAELPKAAVMNIWPAFVVESERRLAADGVMALVLPADLLQVKYAECIRKYLEKSFERLEIFSLAVDAFDGIEQQTVMLFAIRKSREKGTFFYQVDDYEKAKASQISSNGLMITQSKWTHFNLTTSEIELLNSLEKKFQAVGDLVDTKPGVVTGANDFFILSAKDVKKVGAEAYAKPIIYCGRSITCGADFALDDFETIASNGKSCYLLDLRKKRVNAPLDAYIADGKMRQLHMGYKCSRRNPWYVVPNIASPSEAFFFKRTHRTPKLIINSARVYVTDSAYMVTPKPVCELNNFVWSFYNPLTLIYAELTGRRYGGGVLELTPSEFRALPLPYASVSSSTFDRFKETISFNDSECVFTNDAARQNQLGIKMEVYEELCRIYKMLVGYRLVSKI